MTKDAGRFWRYIFPAMMGMFASGVYTIIDTIFIGRGTGELGLAAVSLTWPLTMIFMGLGDLYGAGAGVLLAQAKGAHDLRRPARLLGNAFLTTTVVALVLGALAYPFVPDIMVLFGGTPELIADATVYARTVLVGSVATLWMTTGIAVIRADGHSFLSMCLMGMGFALNILLDWLFILVFRWGAFGAGLAFIVSQSMTALLCFLYFYTPMTTLRPSWGWLKPHLSESLTLTRTGFPIFGNLLSVIAMLFLTHYQALRYGGNEGLAAYTLVATLESLGTMLITGLASGMQPLVAQMFGAGKHKRKNRFGRYGYWSAFGLGLLLTLLCIAMRDVMPTLSGLSGDVATLAANGVTISSTAFILLGVIRVTGFYYQSTGKLKTATLLIYGDSLAVLPLCLIVLPSFFGMDGIWLAMPVSRLLLFGGVLYLWFGKRIGR